MCILFQLYIKENEIMSTSIFTSESVTKGHPDKVCDIISDTILDAYLLRDRNARVAIETMVKNNTVFLASEISSAAEVDIEAETRNAIRKIGYDREELGFNGDTAEILIRIDRQSPDIAQGVNRALESREAGLEYETELGAGDQGMVFGYATGETPELMPLPIALAHRLAIRLTAVRENGSLPYLRPDGKTQVTVRYVDDVPAAVDVIVVSTQHEPDIDLAAIREDIIERVIKSVIPASLLHRDTKTFVNPTGRFVIGGPVGDSGLTGRKIIVDTYGGFARHGGGAFSGKDPTKVDRSAAYAARYVAKNIVAAGLAKKCEIQIAYAIGVAAPVSINVNTFGTGLYPDSELGKTVEQSFDLRPGAIIRTLELRDTKYSPLAAYGHIGREDLPVFWELTDSTQKLRAAFENVKAKEYEQTQAFQPIMLQSR
jgi:S-adenosylmethionine synthetase